jgi:DNA adenine methylase
LRQRGPWKINARFNRTDLIERIERVASYRQRIEVTNLDALDFLATVASGISRAARPFAYLDPPYFTKGQDLYMNHYEPRDHAAVARFVREELDVPWVMSYDDVPEIRRLYRGVRTVPLALDYSARERRRGWEMLLVKPKLAFPWAWREGVPAEELFTSTR